MADRTFFIKLARDEEAGVWYIVDSDFPGLVAEAETREGVLRKVHALVPELLEANRHLIDWSSGFGLPPVRL